MKMTTAADMAGLLLFIFITLMAFPLSQSQYHHQSPTQELVPPRPELVPVQSDRRSPAQTQQTSRTKMDSWQDPDGNRTRSSDSPSLHGPTGESSMEASGFFGSDTEERDGGEDGGAARDRRDGGDEWMDVHHVFKRTRAILDLDAMIGYSPPSPPLHAGSQQQREELWEADAHSSGFGALRSSSTSPPPESDTGTDFGLLGVKGEDERHVNVTVDPPDKGGVCGLDAARRTRLRHPQHDTQPQLCKYTSSSRSSHLNMCVCVCVTQEEFSVDGGVRLLKTMEHLFARRMKSPEGTWRLYLSKPTHQQRQMLMHVKSEHGVISTQVLLSMLTEMSISLNKVGVQNYGAPSTCPPRPSQTHSDYSKLFVVLVIIGSVCMVIIASGFFYICWQRRLPATKSTFRAEELHFVENGCHDNPTLDVAGDSRSETQEKKPSANGLAGGAEGGGDESSGWQVFVNQAAAEEEEEEEQDTHL
uniref:podocalyxin-like protein 2 isoform X1 n=1 Tax=Doryrhamphus excisus TaxID=161450 RepID=UPI0025ADDEB5|nr:podocalyxin-like protein 2 isoform X1 [Doryrhamphus excisus]